MIVTEREREAETQAEGEAGSMHREPDVGLDPGSPGSCPGPKAGAKPLRHPGIPRIIFLNKYTQQEKHSTLPRDIKNDFNTFTLKLMTTIFTC